MQLQQAIETYRTQLTLLIQILTILVVGDVTVTGVALNTKVAAAIGLGAVFPLAMVYVGSSVFRLSIPLIYCAVRIETIHSRDRTGGLMSTFIAFTQSAGYLREMQAIARDESLESQTKRLKKIKAPAIRASIISGRLIMFGLAILHVVVAAVLCVKFGWPLFGKVL